MTDICNIFLTEMYRFHTFLSEGTHLGNGRNTRKNVAFFIPTSFKLT